MATSVTTGAFYGSAIYGTDQWGVTDTTVTLGVGDSVSASTSVGSVSVSIVNARITTGATGTGIVNAGYTDKYDGFYVQTNYQNAYYGEGIYGVSKYGDTSAWTEVEVPQVTGTGAVGGVSISAASETSVSASVFAEIITDAEATLGDEVTVVAKAVAEATGVEGTGEINNVSQRTINRVPVTGAEGSSEITTSVVAAGATTTPTSAPASGSVTTATIASKYTPESAEGTGAVTTVSIAENAQPTFNGVTATNSPGNITISTTTVIFNSANKDHDRTTYVEPDKPRIVYVRAA